MISGFFFCKENKNDKEMFGANFTLHFSLSLLLFNVSKLQNDPMEWFIGSFGMLIKIANNCPRKIFDLVAKPLLLLRPESAMKSLMVNEAYWRTALLFFSYNLPRLEGGRKIDGAGIKGFYL